MKSFLAGKMGGPAPPGPGAAITPAEALFAAVPYCPAGHPSHRLLSLAEQRSGQCGLCATGAPPENSARTHRPPWYADHRTGEGADGRP